MDDQHVRDQITRLEKSVEKIREAIVGDYNKPGFLNRLHDVENTVDGLKKLNAKMTTGIVILAAASGGASGKIIALLFG